MPVFVDRTRNLICALIIAVGGLAAAGSVMAQDQTHEFSQSAAAAINQALIFAQNDELQKALDVLDIAVAARDLTPYETATIYQMMGQYSYELDELDTAQAAFETAVLSGGLRPHEEKNIQVAIAQLMIARGNYSEGGERLKAIVKADDAPKFQYLELIMQAGVQAQDYGRVLPWAELWFERAEVKERQHYDMLYFLYTQLNMRDRQLEFLTEMIEKWPEDKTLLWTFMGQLVIANRDEDAFEVAKLLYLSGDMTAEIDLIKLVKYYAFFDLPFQAAEILEREMEAGRIEKSPRRLKQLGELFIQARERDRALPIFESIVETSDGVEFLSTLGHNYAEVGACSKAEAVLQKVGANGYDAGKGQMLIGNCYYDEVAGMPPLSCNISDAQRKAAPLTASRNAALAAFKKVPEDSRENATAKKWVQFIEAEVTAEEKRCNFALVHHHSPHCFQRIKRAYDAAIFTGGFKLEDESCGKFIKEYDDEFRR